MISTLIDNSLRNRDWGPRALRERDAVHLSAVPPSGQQFEELDRATAVVGCDESVGITTVALVVEVTGGAVGVEGLARPGEFLHGGDPTVLRLEVGLDRGGAPLDALLEQVDEVASAFLCGVRVVVRDTGLRVPEEEAVGESVGLQAVEGAWSALPLVAQVYAVATDDVESGTAGVATADVVSRCEDQRVDLVFRASDDDPVACQPLDSASVGVDELDVVAVERGQEFVVEPDALAEPLVPGLERSAVALSVTTESILARTRSIDL